jgi:hypothetical protein
MVVVMPVESKVPTGSRTRTVPPSENRRVSTAADRLRPATIGLRTPPMDPVRRPSAELPSKRTARWPFSEKRFVEKRAGADPRDKTPTEIGKLQLPSAPDRALVEGAVFAKDTETPARPLPSGSSIVPERFDQQSPARPATPAATNLFVSMDG